MSVPWWNRSSHAPAGPRTQTELRSARRPLEVGPDGGVEECAFAARNLAFVVVRHPGSSVGIDQLAMSTNRL